MRYRWKLLLVLLAIALLPIGVMRSFAMRSARFFADRTISQMRDELAESAAGATQDPDFRLCRNNVRPPHGRGKRGPPAVL